MHRRTLSLYSKLLRRQTATSGSAARYGRSTSVFRESEEMQLRSGLSTSSSNAFNVKAPATTVKTKNPLGTKENLFAEATEEISIEEPILKTTSVEEKTRHSFMGSSEATHQSRHRWETDQYPAIFESKIFKTKMPSGLLELSDSPNLILKHACLILSRMGQVSRKDSTINFESLTLDKRFMRICNLVQRGNYSQNPQSLFLAVHGLQNLGVPTTSDIFKTLAGELKWAMRRCAVRFLARGIEVLSEETDCENKTPQSKDEAHNILESAIETLQRRWVEVTSGGDFIAVFKILNLLNVETRGKLEDRAVEMVQGFYPQEMIKMFVVLGDQKRRPTPLLRSLAFHLSKSDERASAKDLIELTYGFNELTFADPVLMEKVCSDLCVEIPTVENPALISSLLTSLGQMRYKHKGLLQILDEWVTAHLDSLRPFDYAAWLLSCAALNYQPRDKNQFCKKAKLVLSQNSKSNSIEWINIVHGFVILNECSAELIGSVLNPEILKKIDNLGVQNSKTKLKLLNINAVAKNKLVSGYTGPLLDAKYETDWSRTYLSSSDQKLSSVVLDSLGTFLPTDKYLKINQKLDSGVFIDAVCYVNKKMDPLPVTSGPLDTNTISLAIIVQGYSSLCRGVKDPTGNSILHKTILESEGYRVITVPYTEFNASDKLVRRVQYLEQKIKSLSQLQQVEKSNQ